MTINCLTLFPEMFAGFTGESIARRAIESGVMEINAVNIRDFSTDKHNRADDYPFGGGAGMVMMCQPVFDCFDHVLKGCEGKKALNIYMAPGGRVLTSALAAELSGYDVLNVLCGHYEGVDQRIVDRYIDMEVSIGDYVLTGGELPAMVLCDCVMRFVPGVLGNQSSTLDESFADGLLEYPQYTRPARYEGLDVPEVLLSGNHAKINGWRHEQALTRTREKRPDLYAKYLEKSN